MKHNERLQALSILTQLLDEQFSLAQLMPASAECSPMTKEICFGFCRHYTRLSAIADKLIAKRPKTTDVWVVLLMGLYQLHYMHAPDYAVVQETVALLDKIKKSWAKGLVNAVLRNFCRKKEEILASLAQDPGFVYGQPPKLLARLKKDWPHDWQAIAQANDAHPPMTLRVNTSQNSVEDYLTRLEAAGIIAHKHAVAPEGIVLASACDVYSLPGFAEGCVSVQDGAAQLAASLLQLKPGLRVLDACCAPGGKTGHILEREPNLGTCVALDVDGRRLERVKENLARLNIEVSLLQADAQFPERWWNRELFDRILLDAPCSATGVIRRHSDIKLLRTDAEIKAVSETQKAMLYALWPLLAVGGLLVYATCSIMACENEQQIATFVSEHQDCDVVAADGSWGRNTGHGQQILPGEREMDGFFYSVLKKRDA